MDRVDQILQSSSLVAVPDDLRAAYRNLRVLITGAGGSIGSEICRQLCFAQVGELILVGHGENSLVELDKELALRFPSVQRWLVVCDVRDEARVTGVLDLYRPDVVVHAAAHKHVPLMELNPIEAVSNNVLGTKAVVTGCVRCDVGRFVLISSDKAVRPMSWMGAAKRMAELVTLWHGAGERLFCAIRFANVAWSRGSVLPLFKRQIELGGPLTVTHPEARRFFVTLQEAGTLVLRAATYCEKPQVFALEVGEAILIQELAERMIDGTEVEIVYTGLRPGERLMEQMWIDHETVQPTADERIWEDQATDLSSEFETCILDIVTAVKSGDAWQLNELLRQYVPSFEAGERLYRMGRLE